MIAGNPELEVTCFATGALTDSRPTSSGHHAPRSWPPRRFPTRWSRLRFGPSASAARRSRRVTEAARGNPAGLRRAEPQAHCNVALDKSNVRGIERGVARPCVTSSRRLRADVQSRRVFRAKGRRARRFGSATNPTRTESSARLRRRCAAEARWGRVRCARSQSGATWAGVGQRHNPRQKVQSRAASGTATVSI